MSHVKREKGHVEVVVPPRVEMVTPKPGYALNIYRGQLRGDAEKVDYVPEECLWFPIYLEEVISFADLRDLPDGEWLLAEYRNTGQSFPVGWYACQKCTFGVIYTGLRFKRFYASLGNREFVSF